MGGNASPQLAAAVARAGGLGMVGGTLIPPPELARALDELREQKVGAVGINFLMPFIQREAVEVAASRAKVVELRHDRPAKLLLHR
jgi:NAD(P)H-dependent flavin oxidoreductase YrpB (nitropropane dioxygenase family)